MSSYLVSLTRSIVSSRYLQFLTFSVYAYSEDSNRSAWTCSSPKTSLVESRILVCDENHFISDGFRNRLNDKLTCFANKIYNSWTRYTKMVSPAVRMECLSF